MIDVHQALEILSKDSDESVRRSVANNLSTSPATLAAMAAVVQLEVVPAPYPRRVPYSICQLIYDNPNTPPLVKMWLQLGGYNMPLEEFLEAAK